MSTPAAVCRIGQKDPASSAPFLFQIIYFQKKKILGH